MNYWKNKRVLVTGANGFIGNALYKKLTCLGALTTGTQYLSNFEGFIPIDLRDKKAVDSLFREFCFEMVLHTAAVDGNSVFKRENGLRILSENIVMGLNILNAGHENNVPDLMAISSADIYSTNDTAPILEENDYREGINQAANEYIKTKIALELLSLSFAKSGKMRVYLPRPTNVFGPDFSHRKLARGVVAIMIDNALANKDIEIWNGWVQIRDFIYINDCTEMLLKMIESGQPGVCNISSSCSISIIELAKMIIKLTNSKSTIVHKFQDGLDLCDFRVLDTKKRLTFYALQATSLEEGLLATISSIVNRP